MAWTVKCIQPLALWLHLHSQQCRNTATSLPAQMRRNAWFIFITLVFYTLLPYRRHQHCRQSRAYMLCFYYNSSFPESRSYESLRTVFSREVYSQIRFIRLGCMSEVLNILLESWAQMCQTNCTQAHSTSESPAFRPHRKLEAKVGVGPRTGFQVSLAQDEHSCLLKRACHAKLQV